MKIHVSALLLFRLSRTSTALFYELQLQSRIQTMGPHYGHLIWNAHTAVAYPGPYPNKEEEGEGPHFQVILLPPSRSLLAWTSKWEPVMHLQLRSKCFRHRRTGFRVKAMKDCMFY